MRKTAMLLAVAGMMAAFVGCTPRELKVVVSDFSWIVSGKTARCSFRVANQTDEPLTVIVVLEAHRVTEGKDGTKLHPFGLAKVEVKLAGREAKKTEGVIELLDFGSSATKVSYHASLK